MLDEEYYQRKQFKWYKTILIGIVLLAIVFMIAVMAYAVII